jgi:hypothetical protein
VLLFGLALMAGGAGVLIGLRDELGIRLPGAVRTAGARLTAAGSALRRWSGPARPRTHARAVGRAAVPVRHGAHTASRATAQTAGQPVVRAAGHTDVQTVVQAEVVERVRRRLEAERGSGRGRSPAPGSPGAAGSRGRISLPRAVGRATPPRGSIERPGS